MRVRDVMTAEVVVVAPTGTLRDVARLLAERGISGAPVVADGDVVGVVSETDIVRKEHAAEGERDRSGLLARLLGRRPSSILDATTVADVMSSPAIAIEHWMSAVAAAALMVEHDVNRLVVLDHGALVGIVTRADLMRAFARSDEDLATEIRDEVLPSLSWSPFELDVTVEDGQVAIRGAVPEADQEALVRSVHRVLGVVAVAVVPETVRVAPTPAPRADGGGAREAGTPPGQTTGGGS